MDNITGINELMNLHAFFNELRCNLGAVWLEQDSVRFSAPEKFQNQETYDFIKYNKGYISTVLKENNIKSADNFLKHLY